MSRYLERHNVKNSGKNGQFVRAAGRAVAGGIVGGAVGAGLGVLAEAGAVLGSQAGLATGVGVVKHSLKRVTAGALAPAGASISKTAPWSSGGRMGPDPPYKRKWWVKTHLEDHWHCEC